MTTMTSKAITALFLLILIGCESTPQHELVWQGLHVVDVLQTLNGPASDICYKEGNSATVAMIGEHPSRQSLIGWAVGGAVIHWGVSKLLDHYAPAWTLTTWQAVSIADTSTGIYQNNQLGIKLWGDNNHSQLGPNNICRQ